MHKVAAVISSLTYCRKTEESPSFLDSRECLYLNSIFKKLFIINKQKLNFLEGNLRKHGLHVCMRCFHKYQMKSLKRMGAFERLLGSKE